MSLRETVASYFAASDAPEDEQSTDVERVGLFECSDCNRTYVSEEMYDCPNCAGPVEPVPTAKDLGMCD